LTIIKQKNNAGFIDRIEKIEFITTDPMEIYTYFIALEEFYDNNKIKATYISVFESGNPLREDKSYHSGTRLAEIFDGIVGLRYNCVDFVDLDVFFGTDECHTPENKAKFEKYCEELDIFAIKTELQLDRAEALELDDNDNSQRIYN